MAQRIIKEIIIENHPAEITVDRILQEVAAAFDVTADDIKSTNRRANVSLARKIAIYIFKDVKGMTFIQIGNVLNKNHSTMTIHYQDVVKNLKENKQLKDTVDDIIKNLKDNYRRNRDLCIIITAGLYVLQIIDAHVDAHLKSYDISDDLSVEFTPAVNYVYSPTVGGHRPTFGFNFNLNF